MVSDQVFLALIGTVTVLSAAAVSVIVPVINNRQTRAMQAAKDQAAAAEKLAEAEAHRLEKQENWDRQDQVAAEARAVAAEARLVAAKVEEVAVAAAIDSKKLLARQDTLAFKADESVAAAAEAARLLVVSNEQHRAATATITEQLGVLDAQGRSTHMLVNSGYTEIIKSELAGLRRELGLLLQLAAMVKKAGGDLASSEVAIEAVKLQIGELEGNIKTRQDAAKKIEAAAEAAAEALSAVDASRVALPPG